MTRIPRNLPERPAGQGAGLLALHRLHAASAAAKRLPRPDDAEALHDFRVALRRLRVALRLYRRELRGQVPKKVLKRVRRLARATNEARDLEVLESRLKGWACELQSGHEAGSRLLAERLAKRRPQDPAAFVDSARREFHSLEAGLRPALLGASAASCPGRSFGAASAALLKDSCRELGRQLAGIKAASDDKPAHQARIAGKRLRYLLEPFQSRSFPCRKAIGRLKKLQDDLGDVHDLNLAVQAVRRCAKKEVSAWSRGIVEAASLGGTRPGRPSVQVEQNPVPGLARLAALAGRDRERAFGRFRSRWDAGKTAEFFKSVEAAAAKIVPRRPAAGPKAPSAGPAS